MTKDNAHDYLEMIGIANRYGCYEVADIFQAIVVKQKEVVKNKINPIQQIAINLLQHSQRQDSTSAQLEDLIPIARNLNLPHAVAFMTSLTGLKY